MARGTGTSRALSEDKIGKLIRGDAEALKQQATTGGNPVAPTPTTPAVQQQAQQAVDSLGEDGQDVYEEMESAVAQEKKPEETKEEAEKRVVTRFSKAQFKAWFPGGRGGSTEEGLGSEHQEAMNMAIFKRLQKRYGVGKPSVAPPQGGTPPPAAGGQK